MFELPVILDGENLSINDVYRIAQRQEKVELSELALQRVEACHNYVLSLIKGSKRVYGLNTGFGSLADTFISEKDLARLQTNLLRSHSAGVGKDLPRDVVRAAMVLRLNTLLKGRSGAAPKTLELLGELINRDIIPSVPETGSLGASGDLAQLAHIAVALLGEGQVYHRGTKKASIQALREEDLEPVSLGPKEGLALINGTQVSTAVGALALAASDKLVECMEDVASLTIQALGSSLQWLNPLIHEARPIKGQAECAEYMRTVLSDSRSVGRSGRVQEPYCIRCIPQVHGSAREGLRFAGTILSKEINSATDNPLVFPEEDAVISGGNFHAQPVALALDMLAIALTPLGTLSERRIDKLFTPAFSGLPAFLAPRSGVNSGLMISHYTASSLVSENRLLSHPASVDTAVVSGGQEDHASMSLHSAHKLVKIVSNLWYICAIEAICAAQAADLADVVPLLGTKSTELYRFIRSYVPQIGEDIELSGPIEKIRSALLERYIGPVPEFLS